MERIAGVSAMAGLLVFAVANALWAFEQPAPGAPAPELVGFYTDLSSRIVAGGLGSMFAIAIFVVFAAALRGVLARTGSPLLGDAAFGGLLLGLALGLGAEAVNMAAALRAADGELSEELALTLFDISYVFGSYATGIGFGVALLALGASALRSGELVPRWLAIAALAIGAAMVTPLVGWLIGEYTVAPAMTLFAILGGILLLSTRRAAATTRTAAPAGSPPASPPTPPGGPAR